MFLELKTFTLGPLDNNTYLLSDSTTHQGIVIDPSFEIEILLQFCQDQKINISQVWLTHAHYDHFAGIFTIRKAFPNLHTFLDHRDDFLWKQSGLASLWNLKIIMEFTPDITPRDGTILALGSHEFTLLHTPGHTPGHMVFYNQAISSAFCGDLIFKQGIGRTDLPGGSQTSIRESIMGKIFKLPPQTILYSGHGPQTTVQNEINENPFF
jgi:glyoxylase-like metal-dependent hydrolase (beta-lactamase superfamily II)